MEAFEMIGGMNDLHSYTYEHIREDLLQYAKSEGAGIDDIIESIIRDTKGNNNNTVSLATYRDLIVHLEKAECKITSIMQVKYLFQKKNSNYGKEFDELLRYIDFLKYVGILFVPSTIFIEVVKEMEYLNKLKGNAKKTITSEDDKSIQGNFERLELKYFKQQTIYEKIDAMIEEIDAIIKELDEKATNISTMQNNKLIQIIDTNAKSSFPYEKKMLIDNILQILSNDYKEEERKDNEYNVPVEKAIDELKLLSDYINLVKTYIKIKKYILKLENIRKNQKEEIRKIYSMERHEQTILEEAEKNLMHKIQEINSFKKSIKEKMKAIKALHGYFALPYQVSRLYSLCPPQPAEKADESLLDFK